MKAIFLPLAILLWMSAPLLADQGEMQETFGDSTPYHQFDRFFIASQPDMAGLAAASEAGVSLVINLRGISESDWDESTAAGSLGLEYHQVPVNGGAPELAESPFVEINRIVSANPDAKILLHCASGNRAAAWLAYYLAEVGDMSPAQAIETARAHGLTRQGLEAKVEALLND